MFTEFIAVIHNVTASIARPYVQLANVLVKNATKDTIEKTSGGFTYKDWENIGNDLRRSIIAYGRSRLS